MPVAGEGKRFFYNYLHLFAGKGILFGGLQFVTLLLVVRILNVADYGTYVLVLAGASIMTLLVTWTSAGVVRFGREEFDQDGSVRKTLWTMLWILGVCVLVAVGVFAGLSGKVGEYVVLPAFALPLVALYVLTSSLALLVPVFFQAMGRISVFSYIPVISSGLVLATVAVVFGMGMEVTVGWLVAVLIGGNAASVVVGLWLLRRDLIRPCVPVAWMKRFLGYVWPLLFAGVSSNAIRYVDQIVIGLFMAASAVGVYNVAYLLYGYVMSIPILAISLLFPLMVGMVLRAEKEGIARYIRVHAPQVVCLWSLLMATAIVFVREAVVIFGPMYGEAATPLIILLGCVGFRILATVESPVMSSHGFIKESVAISIGVGVVNVGLDFLLVPLMGIQGAAVATAVAFAAGGVTSSFVVWRRLKLNNYRNYPWVLPGLVVMVGALVFDGLLLRVGVLAVVVVLTLVVARSRGIFDSGTRMALERIDMPGPLKRLVTVGYQRVLEADRA